MLDLGAQIAPLEADIRGAIDRVVGSRAFILGPDVAEFEKEMAAYLGVRHAVGCGSGSDALVLALKALGVGPGDEVITTTFSFFATAGSISRVGATPVFVDIDPVTYNIDVSKIEEKITDRTKAIIPVHLYGQMTPMASLMELAKKHDLRVVEDAAQSVGTKEGDSVAGTVGDIGCLSFFPSKNLGAFGDGGMCLTNDDEMATKLRSLRVHGTGKVRYHYEHIGLNSRLDTIQAAVLRVKLPHLDAWSRARQKNADMYTERLAGVPNLVVPKRLDGMFHIYNQYTIRVRGRDDLLATFKSEGVGGAVYYPMPLHLQDCFAGGGGKEGDCPHAEKAANEVMSIPVYGELTEAQIDRVCEVIKAHCG